MTLPMPSLGTGVTVDRGVEIVLRDGTITRGDLFRPAYGTPVPCLLQQIPYGRGRTALSVVDAALEPFLAVDEGFAVLIQDIRGTGASDGTFELFDGAARDGADTVAWIAAQPWSDGTVCTFGTSYSGYTALATAAASDRVKATSTVLSGGIDPVDGFVTTPAGARNLGFLAYWVIAGLAETRMPRSASGGELARLRDRALRDMAAVYDVLPVRDSAASTAPDLWRSLMGREPARLPEPAVPSLTYTGWNDIFLDAALRRWSALQSTGARHDLVIGPWSHGNFSDTVGDVFMGHTAALDVEAVSRERLDFFRTVLEGAPHLGLPVRYFVQGRNEWRESAEWPPHRSRQAHVPVRGDDVALTGDPRHPVPTISGNTYLPGVVQSLHGGPRDRSRLLARPDVIAFDSAPIGGEVLVAGRASVSLEVVADVSTFDLVAHLCVVDRGGASLPYAEGMTRVTEVEPGRPRRVEIPFTDSCFLVPAGHIVRLELSLSDFPRFERNPQRDVPPLTATRSDFRTATVRVLASDAGAGSLSLPIGGDASALTEVVLTVVEDEHSR